MIGVAVAVTPRTPSKPRRARQTTESHSPATRSAPRPICPSCFRST